MILSNKVKMLTFTAPILIPCLVRKQTRRRGGKEEGADTTPPSPLTVTTAKPFPKPIQTQHNSFASTSRTSMFYPFLLLSSVILSCFYQSTVNHFLFQWLQNFNFIIADAEKKRRESNTYFYFDTRKKWFF